MLIESNRWIRNGIAISIESVKLLFRNPILFVYALVPMLTVAFGFFFMNIDVLIKRNFVPAEIDNYPSDQLATYGIWLVITILLGTFFACCLARHTMHILRQQPASLRESCMWVLQHYKQIVAWILVEVLFSWSWLALFPKSMSMILLISAIVTSLFFLGLLSSILLLFHIQIVPPIISTETIAIIPAIKRSSQVVWNNFGTYIVSWISSSVIAALLYILPAVTITLLVGSQPGAAWHSQFFLLLGLPIITVANTLFYYEFYIKRELELQEVLLTTQV